MLGHIYTITAKSSLYEEDEDEILDMRNQARVKTCFRSNIDGQSLEDTAFRLAPSRPNSSGYDVNQVGRIHPSLRFNAYFNKIQVVEYFLRHKIV